MPEAGLFELSPGIHYLPGAVNVGALELPEGGCLLVDSGTDKDHAKDSPNVAVVFSADEGQTTPATVFPGSLRAGLRGDRCVSRTHGELLSQKSGRQMPR